MKTLLTIGGEAYLLPEQKNLAIVLETLKGITAVKQRTIYGPDGEHRYDEECGFLHAQVLDKNQSKIGVSIVLDDEVLTAAQFKAAELKAAQTLLPVAA